MSRKLSQALSVKVKNSKSFLIAVNIMSLSFKDSLNYKSVIVEYKNQIVDCKL